MYDITSRDSFGKLDNWLTDLRSHAAPDLAIMLVGNKCDLSELRAVPINEAKAYAEKNSMLFFETSALDGTNVEAAFYDFVTSQ